MTQVELEEVEAEYLNSLTPEQRSGEIVYKKTNNLTTYLLRDPVTSSVVLQIHIDNTFSCAFRIGRGNYQDLETMSAEVGKKTAFERLSFLVTNAVLERRPMFIPVISRETVMVEQLKSDPRIQLVATTRGSHGLYDAHIFLIDPIKHTYELR